VSRRSLGDGVSKQQRSHTQFDSFESLVKLEDGSNDDLHEVSLNNSNQLSSQIHLPLPNSMPQGAISQKRKGSKVVNFKNAAGQCLAQNSSTSGQKYSSRQDATNHAITQTQRNNFKTEASTRVQQARVCHNLSSEQNDRIESNLSSLRSDQQKSSQAS